MSYVNTMPHDSTTEDIPHASPSLPQDSSESSRPSPSPNADASKAKDENESYFDIFLGVAKVALLFIPFYVFLMVQLSSRPPVGPVLRHDTFSISNFTISNSTLPANWGWDADFSFQNPTENQDIIVNGITGSLYYKDDVLLSSTSVEPFLMKDKRVKTVHVSFAATDRLGNKEPTTLEHSVANQMSKEKKRGIIYFTIKISVWYKYKVWGWFWSSDIFAYLHCWDLAVRFAPDAEKGRLIGDGPKSCPLFL